MENVRTFKRCGYQSKSQEVFTNLSLDLFPGGSLEGVGLHPVLQKTGIGGGPGVSAPTGGCPPPPESQVPLKVSYSQREFFLATVATRSLDNRTHSTLLFSTDTQCDIYCQQLACSLGLTK
ncbi:hypothetical protein NQZ68_008543 [Dissostichus eleginoides]|nr:hypothetical protein NQZ68_008543 [Dissostichus eleginoides]